MSSARWLRTLTPSAPVLEKKACVHNGVRQSPGERAAPAQRRQRQAGAHEWVGRHGVAVDSRWRSNSHCWLQLLVSKEKEKPESRRKAGTYCRPIVHLTCPAASLSRADQRARP